MIICNSLWLYVLSNSAKENAKLVHSFSCKTWKVTSLSNKNDNFKFLCLNLDMNHHMTDYISIFFLCK